MIPAVSIITPTYNRAHLLPRVWKSLSEQTERDFEWVVIDDGSMDRTRETVEEFRDPRIVYVRQENRGINGARNRGERESRAEYIVFLDSDDELYENTSLSEMLGEIRSTRPEIAWVAFTVTEPKVEKQWRKYHLPAERMETTYVDHVCEQRFRGEFCSIFRRDALRLRPFSEAHRGVSSLRWWHIVRNRPVLVIRKTVLICHQGDDNLSGAPSAIRTAANLAEATAELIREHQDTWRQHCPCQLGRYHLSKGAMIALSGRGYAALPSVFMALRFGDKANRKKAVLLLLGLVFPLKVRQHLFLRYAARK